MSEIKEVWDMLWDVYDKAKGTPWENVVPVVVIGAVFFLLFKLVVVPLAKGIFNLYNYISKNVIFISSYWLFMQLYWLTYKNFKIYAYKYLK